MTPSAHKTVFTLICVGMCLIWYGVTVAVSALPAYPALRASGMVMPLLCLLQFIVLVPLYWLCERRYQAIPVGSFSWQQAVGFSAMLLALILSQSLYLPQESWTGGQLGDNGSSLVLFSLAVVLLAPVYEEILFRGFLLQGLLLWAPGQRLVCALLTSIGFAAMHSQYSHYQTFIALSALSLLFCYARLLTGGLLLPVMLHVLNNFIGVLPWLWAARS